MALANHDPMPHRGKGNTSPLAPEARYDAGSRSNAPHRGATHQYQRAQVESASPTRLIVLLYEGAIRFCSLARDAMQKGDLEAQNVNLIRAQRIVGELLASLNRQAGGDVALNLARIYTHMLAELVRANLYDDSEALAKVTTLLTEMRASWIEIDRLQSGDAAGQSSQEPGEASRTAPPTRGAGSGSGSHPTRSAARPADLSTQRKSAPGAASRLEDRLA